MRNDELNHQRESGEISAIYDIEMILVKRFSSNLKNVSIKFNKSGISKILGTSVMSLTEGVSW